MKLCKLLKGCMMVFITAFLLIGCGKKQDLDNLDTENDRMVEVSNLKDDKSIEALKQIFIKAGVEEDRSAVFWEHVEQFNSCKGMESLIDGFKTLSPTENTFDEYEMQDAWSAEHPEFIGYNCRITAFTLFGNHITVNTPGTPDIRNLFLDEEALEEDDSALLEDGDFEKFEALFTTISGENSNDQAAQVAIVNKAWEDMGIEIDDNVPMSLITLYIHAQYSDTDNELFVGHTGILIDLGDDGLYFVEKLAFQAPYRFVRLRSREQLKNYLLERYASYYGENEAAPFVLENGKLMD